MNPDEMIYVGKLLQVFRCADRSASEAIKCSYRCISTDRAMSQQQNAASEAVASSTADESQC